MVHRRWVPYCHSPLFSDLLHPEDGPSQGPHELPANPIHSSYGRLALGTAFTAGYKLPSARAITRSIAVHLSTFARLTVNGSTGSFRTGIISAYMHPGCYLGVMINYLGGWIAV